MYRLGAVAMPLSMLFGLDALQYRLRDSGAASRSSTRAAIDNVLAARGAVPAAATVVAVGGATGEAMSTGSGLREAPAFATAGGHRVPTTPAVLIYTSGTTGPPKGALIPHRALIGNLPGFVCSQNWFPAGTPGMRWASWSPGADWAWTGGLMDALLPTLYFGRGSSASRAASRPRRRSS